MRKISLLISIFGLISLSFFMFFNEDRDGVLIDNEQIYLEGFVEREYFSSEGLIFYINKEKFFCSSCDSLLGKYVKVEGVYVEYFDRINVLKLIF